MRPICSPHDPLRRLSSDDARELNRVTKRRVLPGYPIDTAELHPHLAGVDQPPQRSEGWTIRTLADVGAGNVINHNRQFDCPDEVHHTQQRIADNMNGNMPAKRLHQPDNRPNVIERGRCAKFWNEVKPHAADAGGIEPRHFFDRRRRGQQRDATIAALAGLQCIEQRRVIRAMSGRLNDDTALETEMAVECKQRLLWRIRWREWPPLGIGESAAWTEDVEVLSLIHI